jgi:ElaB/YqjD/DUF883 family membrane-anchored ribosome-binding protein
VTQPTTYPDLSTGSTGGSPGLEASTGARASSGNGRDRIHRFAGTMHQAIDSIEQRLSSAGGGMSSTRARYGEQARQYGDRLRTRMNEQPLQSTGVVLAAGVLLDRLFLRNKPKVRVVNAPVTRATWAPGPSVERRAQRWSDAADAHLQRGVAGTRATMSSLAREASALPLQMRMATQRLMARSQDYGSMARSSVQAHPWAGLGAVVAASGLLTSMLMQRRASTTGTYGSTVDERGYGIARQRSEYDTQTGLGGMISARPVTTSVAVLGLGMLAGAMLRRRSGV